MCTKGDAINNNFGIISGGRITSRFGCRIHPITKKKTFHEGIDISKRRGSPIYAYDSGIVAYAGWNKKYGNFVEIDHGNGLTTRYGHMSAIHVQKGEQVERRQVIGTVGSTGLSTGSHLHFEMLIHGVPQNPLPHLSS